MLEGSHIQIDKIDFNINWKHYLATSVTCTLHRTETDICNKEQTLVENEATFGRCFVSLPDPIVSVCLSGLGHFNSPGRLCKGLGRRQLPRRVHGGDQGPNQDGVPGRDAIPADGRLLFSGQHQPGGILKLLLRTCWWGEIPWNGFHGLSSNERRQLERSFPRNCPHLGYVVPFLYVLRWTNVTVSDNIYSNFQQNVF